MEQRSDSTSKKSFISGALVFFFFFFFCFSAFQLLNFVRYAESEAEPMNVAAPSWSVIICSSVSRATSFAPGWSERHHFGRFASDWCGTVSTPSWSRWYWGCIKACNYWYCMVSISVISTVPVRSAM